MGLGRPDERVDPVTGRLRNTVAVVTGGAQGIGECIATRFAREGAQVLVGDIRETKAEEVAAALRDEGLEVESALLDIREPDSAAALMARAVERWGRIDVLVNNAGLDAPPGPAWAIGEDEWREVIETDLSGPWWCTRAVLPHMMERRRGRVIFISSGSARIGAPEISVAYNAAKAGVVGLTVGLAVHLEPYGILVNAVAPGPTGTGTPMTPEERAAYERDFPLGIVGPEPVAHACVYLAAESGDWVSGSVLNVSGGWWRGF
jgi:NAD(P)-dependent dehydrogenase (short-subunit alcohol dehydrogenase family)